MTCVQKRSFVGSGATSTFKAVGLPGKLQWGCVHVVYLQRAPFPCTHIASCSTSAEFMIGRCSAFLVLILIWNCTCISACSYNCSSKTILIALVGRGMDTQTFPVCMYEFSLFSLHFYSYRRLIFAIKARMCGQKIGCVWRMSCIRHC